jgi:hypothetical protein
MFGWCDTGCFQEGRGKIEETDQALYPTTTGETGPDSCCRYMHCTLMARALVIIVATLLEFLVTGAKMASVITGKKHNGILEKPQAL